MLASDHVVLCNYIQYFSINFMRLILGVGEYPMSWFSEDLEWLYCPSLIKVTDFFLGKMFKGN